MTPATTDNSFQPLASLSELGALETLRVTQIAKLIECPRQWKSILLGEGVTGDDRASKIGTAVHLCIEAYLSEQFDVGTPECLEWGVTLESQGVPPKERVALWNYLLALQPMRPFVKELEREAQITLVAGAPRVQGHIDAIVHPWGAPLIIRDHKTNRTYKGPDWWRQQWQPRLYACLVRSLCQYQGPIVFEIGYVNLATIVRWETDPMDWFTLHFQYARAWAEVEESLASDQWREQANDNCGFCPVRSSCVTAREAAQQLLGAIGQRRTIQEKGSL